MIDYLEGGAIIETPQVAFTYKTEDKIRDFDKYSKETTSNSLDWTQRENYIGDYILHQYGSNNDLPTVIRDVVQRNYIAPGLLRKKTGLLWGMGPMLYKEEFKNNRRVRTWLDDTEVQSWLNSFEYESYLLQGCEEYQYIQGTFTKFENKKGNNFIHRLEAVQPDKARLASLRNANSRKPTHVITNDWSFESPNSLLDYKVYSLFDFRDPFAKPNSIFYSNLKSFCSDYYSVPEIYGSLEWLNRSTAVPLIFKAMSRNSINLKFHITSPQAFWDKKREEISANCTKLGKTYKEQMLIDYQTEFLRKIGEVLSGDENTGKYLHTVDSLYVDGHKILELGWKIQVIDQKVKDYVKAQIEISQRADYALTAGIGLPPAIAGISDTGKANGGSEQYYALIGYLNTGIDIPEMIICKPLNYALSVNFPKKGLKIGFYHNVPEKQEDIAPEDRIKNQETK